MHWYSNLFPPNLSSQYHEKPFDSDFWLSHWEREYALGKTDKCSPQNKVQTKPSESTPAPKLLRQQSAGNFHGIAAQTFKQGLHHPVSTRAKITKAPHCDTLYWRTAHTILVGRGTYMLLQPKPLTLGLFYLLMQDWSILFSTLRCWHIPKLLLTLVSGFWHWGLHSNSWH